MTVLTQATRGSPPGLLGTLLVHLRLPFQLLLAPIFLWGWLLAGGGWSAAIAVAFVAFHGFLYGGVTAYNSYFDRDEGPVGGLEHPPPVAEALLPFSLAVQAVGWLLAALVNGPFFLIYGGFMALSVAYSHPRIRWKARPVASLAVVGVGQGILAFLGAWVAARGDLAGATSPPGVLGAAAATLLVLGLYPLTQLYQIEEDRARGDRTLAVAWGPRASFAVAIVAQALGGAALAWTVAARYGPADAALLGLGVLGQVAFLWRWAGTFDASRVRANYRRVTRLNTAAAAALGGYCLVRLTVG